MPAKWEFTKQTKAAVPKAIEYFMHPEDMPKRHPDFAKQVTVKSREGDTVTFEQQLELMKRKLNSLNRLSLNRDQNLFQIDILEGDGKGSKIAMALREIPNNGGTEIKYNAEMELGPLGFFAKGPAKSAMEKVADEDAKFLDSA